MTTNTHGLSIGIERTNNTFYVHIKAVGKLTHSDYEAITPMFEAALAEAKEPKVKTLIDATALRGWDLHAAWDDFRLGLRHSNEFEKIALVGHKDWQAVCTKMFSWFISGETKFFTNKTAAIKWLLA
ncbi:SpoIIAA family protein [Ostreibacterium oceani]|uniref:STAS/SEC14 domain-containing protein n=1 Tax=Ostreibacterium oceani TaxID=2654998 RepID=A0A6N7EYN6_9GAMM|nr:STAS/SEC14 domain-containing protein [Ostreibacterium oceani]MPV86257.1 STAS/SEC14 domain-containing protein [Ostreibacterium oceani]